MGGNALADFGVQRIDTPELTSELAQIQKMLNHICPGITFVPIAWYNTKPNHGDIDILYTMDTSIYPLDYVFKSVIEGYNPIAFHADDKSLCFSFVWKCKSGKKVQTDLIYTPIVTYDFAKCYYSYNDLGNLLGVLFKVAGLKLGHQGLIYTLKEDTRVIAEIVITHDWEQALSVLGYDNYHNTQFDTLEDIFNYVSDCKYFSPHWYNLSTRNHDSRIRDKKRKTYMEFLKWIETKTFKKSKSIDTNTILNKCFRLFPDFKLRYDNVLKEDADNKIFKQKLSGNVISKVTGLKLKELGRFNEKFRKHYADKLKPFVLASSNSEIEKLIKDYYESSLFL